MGAHKIQENVDTFLHLLGRVKPPSTDQLIVQAWVHVQTGELSYEPQEEGALWRPFSIRCAYRKKGHATHFSVDGELTEALEPQAARVMQATLGAFRALEQYPCVGKNLKEQCKELSRLAEKGGESSDEQILTLLLREVDRSGAEQLLGKGTIPLGTYILRTDGFIQDLARQLGSPCVAATVKLKGECYAEYLLVHTRKGWQIYNDDPSFHNLGVAQLRLLLRSRPTIFLHALGVSAGKQLAK
jgi:hypothetical protein